MRYDTKIIFLEKAGEPVYDETTGNITVPEQKRVTVYGAVSETAQDARELMYGSVLVKSLTVHTQGRYPGNKAFLEGAEIDGKLYSITQTVDLRAKTVFYLREA